MDNGSQMTKDELQPCPFCGRGNWPHHRRLVHPVQGKTVDDAWSIRIKCHGCGSLGPVAVNETEAMAFWNQRLSPREPESSGS